MHEKKKKKCAHTTKVYTAWGDNLYSGYFLPVIGICSIIIHGVQAHCVIHDAYIRTTSHASIMPLPLQFVISDDETSERFDVEIRIVPAIVDNPPQFEDQLNIFSISESAMDGVLVGTINVTDDMGKQMATKACGGVTRSRESNGMCEMCQKG